MTKKVGILVLLTIIVSVLCGCHISRGHQQIEPLRIETEDFDIETATQMISAGEKIIADMVKKDTATREEYEQFLIDINNIYPDHTDTSWERMFFDNREIENKDIKVLNLSKNLFYPTIYHQGVEVVSAYVEKLFYEYDFMNIEMLHICEEYIGDDIKMAEWNRAYIFIKRDDGEWQIGSGARGNFAGEGIDKNYLPFK